MTLNELAKKIHKNAVEKGWYDPPKTILEACMLFITEIAEAVEELRKNTPPFYYDPNERITTAHPLRKPEGWAVELCDAVIRILDTLAAEDIDIDKLVKLKMDYNATRPRRHGGKRW